MQQQVDLHYYCMGSIPYKTMESYLHGPRLIAPERDWSFWDWEEVERIANEYPYPTSMTRHFEHNGVEVEDVIDITKHRKAKVNEQLGNNSGRA